MRSGRSSTRRWIGVPHLFKANGIWNSPGIQSKGAVLRHLTRDWQVSAVATVVSGGAYGLGYSYQNNGGNVNLTGSADCGARVTLLDGLGSGCTGLDNQYAQFNYQAIRPPTYGSNGMESGRNYMRGCMTRNVDMSFVRRIRVSSSERYRVELRADVFNAFNILDINGRSTSATVHQPDEPDVGEQPVQCRRQPGLEPAEAESTPASARQAAPGGCATFSCSSASSSKLGFVDTEAVRSASPPRGTAR